jgi:hypothetical protein
VYPYVYAPSERCHFDYWFFRVYLPEHFPDYLRNKFKVGEFGLSPASVADHVNLSMLGSPAQLAPRVRGALTAAGGFVPHTPRVNG